MNRPLRASALLGILLAVSLPIACTAQPPGVAVDPSPAVTPPTAPPIVTGLPDFTELVERVGPAVVNISAETAPRRSARAQQFPPGTEELFRRFFGPDVPLPGGPNAPQGPGNMSLGTGFLISSDGYVLTNRHVIEGADEVTVKLSDRREFKAKVVGSDEQYDVALLKIPASGLPWLRDSRTKPLQPGQWVVAIGSPFGLDHSVTAGIVSAVGRSNPYAGQQYVPFIQTDVAINRGNSGGPLLNTSGEVVGINSQIFSNSGGYMGVSFAIPIGLAMSAVEQLKDTGRVSRGLLGVQVSPIEAQHAKGLGLPDTRGALVAVVSPGSAAAKAGIQRMDVIRKFDGKPVDDSSDLPPLVGSTAPGSRVKVTVFRGGRDVDVDVVIGELDAPVASTSPRQPSPAPAPEPAVANALGIAGQDMTPSDRQRLGLAEDEGVVLSGVTGAAALEAGLRPGDIILAVGRETVANAAALDRRLGEVKPGDTVMLLVRRGDGTQYIAVTAQDVG